MSIRKAVWIDDEKAAQMVEDCATATGKTVGAVVRECIFAHAPLIKRGEEIRQKFMRHAMRARSAVAGGNPTGDGPSISTMRPYVKESASAIANAARRTLRALHKTVLTVNGAGVALRAA